MRPKTLFAACALLACALPARAWDATGHEVIARIAWEAMRPETRARAVALLKAAPPDADLASLLPAGGPRGARERQLFELAATWPDIVRDKNVPARMEKYNRPEWHYINHFWEQAALGAPARDRADLAPAPENAVERLHQLETSLADASRPAADRAIDLAWVVHLVGDLHQPLHACSRVTPEHPEGDHGGNEFKLAADSLHWWWDQTISRSFPKNPGEALDPYVGRVAHHLEAQLPRRIAARSLRPGDYENWAAQGYATCKADVYAPALQPGADPPAAYADQAREIAAPAAALAGYRLAAFLDRALR